MPGRAKPLAIMAPVKKYPMFLNILAFEEEEGVEGERGIKRERGWEIDKAVGWV